MLFDPPINLDLQHRLMAFTQEEVLWSVQSLEQMRGLATLIGEGPEMNSKRLDKVIRINSRSNPPLLVLQRIPSTAPGQSAQPSSHHAAAASILKKGSWESKQTRNSIGQGPLWILNTDIRDWQRKSCIDAKRTEKTLI